MKSFPYQIVIDRALEQAEMIHKHQHIFQGKRRQLQLGSCSQPIGTNNPHCLFINVC